MLKKGDLKTMKILSKEDFITTIIEELQNDNECKFIVKDIKKNGVKSKGISINLKKENNLELNPIIYPETFYDDYKKKLITIDKIKFQIKYILLEESKRVNNDFNANDILDYNLVKNKIIPQIINMKNVEEKNICIPLNEDIGIIFRLIIDEIKNDSFNSAIVNTRLLTKWNINSFELYKDALNNIKKNIFLADMNDLIINGMNYKPSLNYDDYLDHINAKELFQLVVTTNYKLYGAAVILDNNLMELIYNKIGKYYIIPSSIHEIIIFPKEKGSLKDIKKIVMDVNSNTVEEKDFLSNEIYEWENGKLIIAK
jgi:hypothetical protein